MRFNLSLKDNKYSGDGQYRLKLSTLRYLSGYYICI